MLSTTCPDCGQQKYKYANFCNKCKNKGNRNPMYGKNHSVESKERMSKNGSRSGRLRVGPLHPMWKGNLAQPSSGRDRARRWLSLKPCEVCGALAERHHKDENPLNNVAENIAFLCRLHHKHQHLSKPVDRRCIICDDEFTVPSRNASSKRKTCSNNCLRELLRINECARRAMARAAINAVELPNGNK